jgi:PAS domain S-box-containing protein
MRSCKSYYLYEHTNESSSEEILLKDGRVLDRYSAPMRGADGIFYGRIWYFRDITVRKRLNEEIRNSQRNLKYIIDFFPDAIMGIDRDKRVTIWNRAIEKMTGIPADEMIGKGDYAYTVPFYGIQRPQLMDLFWVPDHEIAAKYPGLEKEGDNLVTEVFCPSLYGGKGALIWAKAAPLLDNEGRLAGAIESLRDITAQRNAEDLLHKSEERFRRLTENAHDIIYRMSLPDGTYEYVSPAVFEITGYTPEEFYDDPSLIRNIIHPASRPYFALQWENLQRGEVPPVYEFRIINRSGQEKWVYQRNVLVLDDQGNPAAIEGIVTDITAIKKIEPELSDAKIMLEAAFEQTPIPMVLVSMPDAVIRVVNTATRKFLGLTTNPLQKTNRCPASCRHGRILIPQAISTRSTTSLGRAMRGENVVGEEYYLITRNGEKK